MKEKIRTEKWLIKKEYFNEIKWLSSNIQDKQETFTDFLFLSQVTRCHKREWLYNNKVLSLFNETHFRFLCENYGIKIKLMEKTELGNLKLITDSSTIFTYLNDTERAILMIMGEIGVALMTNKETEFLLNSSFEESVFAALGYKIEHNTIILQ